MKSQKKKKTPLLERNARCNPASLEARGTHPKDGSGELYKRQFPYRRRISAIYGGVLQFIFLSALLHLGFFAAVIAPSIKTADYGAKGDGAVMVSLYLSGGPKGHHPAGNSMSEGGGANALLNPKDFGTGSVRPENTLTANDPTYPLPRPQPRKESTPASLSKEDDGISFETAVKENYARGKQDDEISVNAISRGFIPGKEDGEGRGGHNNYREGGEDGWGGGGDGGDGEGGWWSGGGGEGGGGSGKNIKNYITLISDSIKRNIYYPVSAWRYGIEGKVLTSFLIETDGKAKDVRIKVSSGSTILDRCALKIIEKSLPLPAPPLKGLRVEVPLVFSLKNPPKAALPKNL